MKKFTTRKIAAAALTALTAGTLTTALAPSASAAPAPQQRRPIRRQRCR